MALAETLMRQAGYTAEEWMHQGIKAIDGVFGEGYAKKNPALLGHFMQAAGLDEVAMHIRMLIEDGLEVRVENGRNSFDVSVD